MEFDEGVVLYSEAEVIKSGDHPLSVQATLLFNAGQARRKLDDVAGAVKFYKDALRLFLPDDVKMSELSKYLIYTVHRIIVPILHNLGQLAYREGSITEAISFYELSLYIHPFMPIQPRDCILPYGFSPVWPISNLFVLFWD